MHSVPQRNSVGNKFKRLLGNISQVNYLYEHNQLLLRMGYLSLWSIKEDIDFP